MDIYLGKDYIFRKITSGPKILDLCNTCPCDIYSTRRVLKIDFMRSAVPVLGSLSFKHANRNLFCIMIGTFLRKPISFPIILSQVVGTDHSQCLSPPSPSSQHLRMHYEIMSLKIKC